MTIAVRLTTLFALYWRTACVEGVAFTLNGNSISNSGNALINIDSIGEFIRESDDYSNALVCRSERPVEEVAMFMNWYVDPDGSSPDTSGTNRLTDDTYEMYGWVRNRSIDDNHQAANLRRLSTAVEGYFTGHIDGDTNTPSGVYILYPLSVAVSVKTVSRRQRTFEVTCMVTGGHLSSGSLTGPGLGSVGLSLPTTSSSNRGQNTYSTTSETLSEDLGSVYTCTATNDVSSPETSLALAVAGNPALEQLVPLSHMSVRITWSAPTNGITVTGYTVHYTRDDGSTERISDLPPSSTSADITGLTSGSTYTITVESRANGLSGESEEKTITLRPPDPPEGVYVTAVEPSTVRVFWQPVQNANRYTVTFTQATGDDQQGLCLHANHTANVSVVTIPANIDVGQDVGDESADMLRAYTTYFVTVVAVSDALGASKESEPAKFTTVQRGAAESPSSPSAINHTSTTITLQWSGLQTCRLVNGVIVKYRVQYAAQPSGSVQSTDQSVDCRNITEMVLTELTPFTTYSIQVAAINEEGDVGMYSGPISEMTNEYALGMDLNCECESSIAPIIMGVIIGILGVAIAIGASGLIIGTFIVKKHRPAAGDENPCISTSANSAYGQSSPREERTEGQGNYETNPAYGLSSEKHAKGQIDYDYI